MTDWKRPQPAPKHAGQMLRANFPMITAVGIYNDRPVRGTEGLRNPPRSSHAEGRALDIHLNAKDERQRTIGDALFGILIQAAYASGIDNVIWNQRIWSQSKGGPRPYIATSTNPHPNPHTDHIHVEFNRAGSQNAVLPLLDIKIAQLRTGLEELTRPPNRA